MSIELDNSEFVNCWNCDQYLQVGIIRNADGFCPCCDVEIDLASEPYFFEALNDE